MSSMLAQIKTVMKEAIKSNNSPMKMATRMVIGEIPRLNKLANQEPTNAEVTKIIKGLIKSERMVVEYSGSGSSPYLESLESLLPKTVGRDSILSFINTVDVSKLKNKMQLISIVKKHFGEENVDSAEVKDIVENYAV